MREIEFKALAKYKNTEPQGWIFSPDGVFHHQSFHNDMEVLRDTICQLITTIRDVKLYEYDCYLNSKDPYFIKYFYYNDLGILVKKEINITKLKRVSIARNTVTNYAQTDQLIGITELILVGNWHDGEEAILKRIKELEK